MKKLLTLIFIIFPFITYGNSEVEKNAAQSLAKQGIINMQETATGYNLGQNVLRQEIAKVAANIAGVAPKTTCAGQFMDVSVTNPNDWACGYVEALLGKGLISANAYFNPESNITKAEAVKMMLEAAGFTDIYSNANNWQVEVVDFAFENGILEKVFIDYNIFATRGFVFEIANNSIEVLKDEYYYEYWDFKDLIFYKKNYDFYISSDIYTKITNYNNVEEYFFTIHNDGLLDNTFKIFVEQDSYLHHSFSPVELISDIPNKVDILAGEEKKIIFSLKTPYYSGKKFNNLFHVLVTSEYDGVSDSYTFNTKIPDVDLYDIEKIKKLNKVDFIKHFGNGLYLYQDKENTFLIYNYKELFSIKNDISSFSEKEIVNDEMLSTDKEYLKQKIIEDISILDSEDPDKKILHIMGYDSYTEYEIDLKAGKLNRYKK